MFKNWQLISFLKSSISKIELDDFSLNIAKKELKIIEIKKVIKADCFLLGNNLPSFIVGSDINSQGSCCLAFSNL